MSIFISLQLSFKFINLLDISWASSGHPPAIDYLMDAGGGGRGEVPIND